MYIGHIMIKTIREIAAFLLFLICQPTQRVRCEGQIGNRVNDVLHAHLSFLKSLPKAEIL